MIEKFPKNGFTLVEVVVATVIFAIGATGLFSVFSMTRRTSNLSERRLQAAYLGKQILEDMRTKVDQSIWDDGLNNWTIDVANGYTLSCDGSIDNAWPDSNAGAGNPIVDNFGAQVFYTCSQDATTGIRQIDLKITWNEP